LPALAPPSKLAPTRFGRGRAFLYALVLLLSLASSLVPGAHAATYHWTGQNPSSPNWTSSLNWDAAGVPPSNGTADVVISLSAPAPSQPNPDVNAAWSILGLTLGGIDSHLSGSVLTIGANGITKTTSEFIDGISNDITLAADQVWFGCNFDLFGSISLGAHTLVVNVPPGLRTSIEGTISGTGSLKKSGPGPLFLNVPNTYSGGTQILAGTLKTFFSNLIPAGTLTMSGGQLDLSGNTETVGPGAIVAPGIAFTGSGSVDPPTVTIGMQLSISTLGPFISYDASNQSPASIGGGPLNLGTTSNTREIFVDNSPTVGTELTISSVIVNPGGNVGSSPVLQKSGSGRLALGGANSFARGVQVQAGALRVTDGQALGDGGTTVNGTTVDDGAALELTGDITVATEWLTISGDFGGVGALRSLSGDNHWNGPITLSAPPAAIGVSAGTLHVGGSIATGGGPISGLTKVGVGTLVLEAANTYSGPTTLSAGTLQVENSSGSATSAGPVQVKAVATLAGSGIITGSVDVDSLGTVAPGASTGVLRLGTLALHHGAVARMEIGGLTPGSGHDQIAVTSGATLGGELRVTLANGFIPALGDEFVLLTYASHLLKFDYLNLPPLPPGLFWTFDYGPTSMRVKVVDTVLGTDVSAPHLTTLRAPSPNPSRTPVAIAYDVAEAATVAVLAYDISGREVARPLEPTWTPPGRYSVPWAGTDRTGRRLAAGTYFLRLVVSGKAVGRAITIQRLR